MENQQPQRSVRRSARLQKIRQQNTSKAKHPESKRLLSAPSISDIPSKGQDSPIPLRSEAVEQHCSPNGLESHRNEILEERPRTSLASCVVDQNREGINMSKNDRSISHWIEQGNWPEEYFRQKDIMSLTFAKNVSSASYHSQAFETSSVTSTQTQDKSLPYKDRLYQYYLESKGSFLHESELGITDACKTICQVLLDTKQTVPQDSLFRDDCFEEVCRDMEGRNEARVLDDIGRLIVPSAERLKAYGAVSLEHLIVNINEGWTECIPVTDTRPQPDFSVGFKPSVFTDDQIRKLKPYIGDVSSRCNSPFLATWQMYFPFFACEAKSRFGHIDVADNQNAHSMTIAVRGIVELFKLVQRENELHQKVLAFSISHDHKNVRIYGHYALIEKNETKFYRHPIHEFNFTLQNGKEKLDGLSIHEECLFQIYAGSSQIDLLGY